MLYYDWRSGGTKQLQPMLSNWQQVWVGVQKTSPTSIIVRFMWCIGPTLKFSCLLQLPSILFVAIFYFLNSMTTLERIFRPLRRLYSLNFSKDCYYIKVMFARGVRPFPCPSAPTTLQWEAQLNSLWPRHNPNTSKHCSADRQSSHRSETPARQRHPKASPDINNCPG